MSTPTEDGVFIEYSQPEEHDEDESLIGEAIVEVIAVAVTLRKNPKQGIKEGAELIQDFTKNNFRKNLNDITGVLPDGSHAHHVFPQKYRDKFEELGLNIDDPKYGAWWEKHDHLSNSKEYNKEWDNFFEDNPNPTEDQILEQGRSMMSEYGIDINF